MEVFIPYERKSDRDGFEGARARKTLKGECEVAGITWADNALKEPNLAHFVACQDEGTLTELRWRHIPVVVSAGYAENDPYFAFLTHEANGSVALSAKAVRFLNKADMVLVPNEMMKKLCLGAGVKTPLRVHVTAINLNRFLPNTAEAEIFPRYYAIRPEEKVVVITGEFEDRACIKLYRELALSCPETEFYFFGSTRRASSRFWIGHYSHRAPANLHFKNVVQDDVYRSAMMRSNAFVHFDSRHPASIGLLDAFAAKTQVITLYENPYEPMLKNGVTAWVCSTVDEVSSALRSLYSGERKSTIIAGYEMAKSHSLEIGAKELSALYSEMLTKKKQ